MQCNCGLVMTASHGVVVERLRFTQVLRMSFGRSRTGSVSPSEFPRRAGVLILQWVSDDQSVPVEYEDGIIERFRTTRTQTVTVAASILGPDNTPQELRGGTVPQC